MTAAVQSILSPNLNDMREHIEHLFGGYLDGYHEGLVELAWTKTTPDAAGKYRLSNGRMYGTDELERLVEDAARFNSQPMCNVYVGAWLRKPGTAPFARGLDSDAWVMTAAYADLDDEGATAVVKDIYKENKPTWVVLTGQVPHSRAQLWWRLEEPITDHARGEALIRGMSSKLNGDSTVCNPGRVMRLAGSVAWPVKDGRTLELTYHAPIKVPGLPVYAAEHLERIFPPVAQSATVIDITGPRAPTESGQIYQKLEDGREAYMVRTLAATLLEYIGQNGCAPTPQELYDVSWPQYERNVDFARAGRGPEEFAEKCAYTIQRFERGAIRGLETLDRAIEVYQRKARARAEAGKPAEPKLLPKPSSSEGIAATAFVWLDPATIPPREWIYGRHYIRKFVSSTVAPGGVGKSSLVIAELLAICTGRPLLGEEVTERVNVWLWNGEDPQEELNRRVMATALQYELKEADIAGRLFVDNGRQMPIVIAERTRDGVTINAPVVDQVIKTIQDNKLGVMVIDPFIACHRVTENDNNEIDRVAKIWSAIADVTGCSIELVHHVRKTQGGSDIQVEDGRGAGALLAAARAARALNRMTEEEGAKAGVKDHRFYFRADDGKANLAPPSANAKWFQMVSYDLKNSTEKRPSDKIGVVAAWAWPDHTDGVTASDMEAVRQRAASGRWRADAQAADWIGLAIIDALGLEITEATKAQAKSLQAMWTKTGALKEVKELDERRRQKTYIKPGAFNENGT